MSSKRLLPLLSLLLLVSAAACDKASPVAPTGTTLTISANPTKIGLNGQSTITVVGRKPDGNPLNPGTEIRLSTDRGTIAPIVEVGDGGAATTTFRSDGRPGTAMISATTGAGDVTATASIQIGETPETRPSLLVSVNPSVIPVEGTSQVTVIARNADGSAVAAGQEIILTSSLGSLSPQRPRTRDDGTATSTLRAGPQSGTATVTAVLGASEAASATVEIKDLILTLTSDTQTVFESQGDPDIQLEARVRNFQGGAVSGVLVEFASGEGTLSPQTALTDGQGIAMTTLSVPQVSITANRQFNVTATIISGSGEEITDTVVITIQNEG